MEFTLLGKPIEISEGRKNYMRILTDYTAIAEQAEKDFKQEYERTFGTVFLNSTYFERFRKTYGSENYMDGIVKRYVSKTRQYLAGYGVYNLSDSEIWNNAIITSTRNVSRLQYEFNSFEDSLLMGNDQLDNDTYISRLKSKLSSDFFPVQLYNDVMSLCDYVHKYLSDNGIIEIQFVYKKTVSEAEAIFKNLLDANIPVADQERLARSLIEFDPRSKLYYEYIFDNFPTAKYEIVAIARYLSIDMSSIIEKDIKRTFDLKAISTEDDALQMMQALQDTMKKFGVSKSSRQTELEKILRDFDIKARTYDGVLYDTRELRTLAENDDCILDNLHGDVRDLDKTACSSHLAEIAHMQCTPAIKSKHLQLLNDRIAFIDNEYLEHLLDGLDNRSERECSQIKGEVENYDAPEDTKAPFLARIEKRIYTIWDEEDFARFSEIYIQTQVSNSEQVGKNCVLIQNTGRTETKELFVKALYLLNENEVEAAAKYAIAKESGMFASLLNMGKKETYEILTLNGRVMHPAIHTAMEVTKAKKSAGIFSGFKKNKATSHTPQMPLANNAKFCSACGAKLEGASKFCSNCGNKLS